ncbi:hypothetical protein [Methanogenium sp. MK-MG]|nr:hypothetical protein [Methanogenium sp. MK-MG]
MAENSGSVNPYPAVFFYGASLAGQVFLPRYYSLSYVYRFFY